MPIDVSEKSIFSNVEKFQQVQFMAEFLSQSDLVPKDYQKKPANVLIALSMAERMKADPMMVMRNLYVIHGRPSWSSQFLIACANSCGRFSSLQYEFSGTVNADDWSCFAYATELSTNQVVKGPTVSIAMAKAEGWHGKNGSKWKTLPELMLTYRAAAFFIRTKAPEVSMGIYTKDEELERGRAVVVNNGPAPTRASAPRSTENMLDNLGSPPLQELPEATLSVAQDVPVDDFDYVKNAIMSISFCKTIEDLEQCGKDIEALKDDDLLDANQLKEVRAAYSAASKSFKNQ